MGKPQEKAVNHAFLERLMQAQFGQMPLGKWVLASFGISLCFLGSL